MGQLDEVSQSIGKLQSTVEAHTVVHAQILAKLDSFERSLTKKLDEHDNHIARLNEESSFKKGAFAVMAGLAGIVGAGMIKLLELIMR